MQNHDTTYIVLSYEVKEPYNKKCIAEIEQTFYRMFYLGRRIIGEEEIDIDAAFYGNYNAFMVVIKRGNKISPKGWDSLADGIQAEDLISKGVAAKLRPVLVPASKRVLDSDTFQSYYGLLNFIMSKDPDDLGDTLNTLSRSISNIYSPRLSFLKRLILTLF